MLRNTKKVLFGGLLALAVFFGSPQAVRADLADVGPINLQNGFPLWWEDLNGTQVELCLEANCPPFEPVIAGNPFSEQIGFSGEAFWWAAGADIANPLGLGLFELAMEAAFLPAITAPGNQEPFVRLRARFDVAVAGTYTITYPFGTLTVTGVTVADGINETIDIPGFPDDIPPFAAALTTGTPQVTANETTNGVSIFFSGVDPTPPLGFMGVPGAASTIDVTGITALTGATVTITGPPDAFGAGVDSLNNGGLWDVAGKLFVPGNNLAPIANPDIAGTQVGTPVTIDVAANDSDVIAAGVNDHGLNLLAVALGSDTVNLINNAIGATSTMPTDQGGTAAINADGTITYTPPPTFSGLDTFSYLIQDTGGLVDTAQVNVTVEQLTGSQASLRPRFLKWNIGGSSTIIDLSGTDAANDTFYFTPLSGALNTPPKPTSTGNGTAMVTVLTDVLGAVTGLDFSLEVSELTGITAAHIHAAPTSGFLGEIVPIAVTLFDADGVTPSVAGPTAVDSPLTVNPLTRFPAGDLRNTATVTDVDDPVGGPLPDLQAVVDAILVGRAYVQIHTLANLPGEIRGQLGRNTVALRVGSATGPVVGAAMMEGSGINGSWSFAGKSEANPGGGGTIHATFGSGNVISIPLQRR